MGHRGRQRNRSPRLIREAAAACIAMGARENRGGCASCPVYGVPIPLASTHPAELFLCSQTAVKFFAPEAPRRRIVMAPAPNSAERRIRCTANHSQVRDALPRERDVFIPHTIPAALRLVKRKSRERIPRDAARHANLRDFRHTIARHDGPEFRGGDPFRDALGDRLRRARPKPSGRTSTVLPAMRRLHARSSIHDRDLSHSRPIASKQIRNIRSPMSLGVTRNARSS
jgi:hypothetical protein